MTLSVASSSNNSSDPQAITHRADWTGVASETNLPSKVDVPPDAMQFHERVEAAAKTIQDNFRARRLGLRDDDDTLESTDGDGDGDDDEETNKTEEEPEEQERTDYSHLFNLIFIAAFGFGTVLYKIISSCLKRGDDTGGADAGGNLRVDGAGQGGGGGNGVEGGILPNTQSGGGGSGET